MATLRPILQVANVAVTLRYYRDVLGFDVDLLLPDASGEPIYAEVSRNGVGVMLGQAQHISEAARAVLGAGVTFYISDDDEDIDTYYAAVRRRGANVLVEVADQFWGDRTFTVEDPDGYRLEFAARVRALGQSTVPAAAGCASP